MRSFLIGALAFVGMASVAAAQTQTIPEVPIVVTSGEGVVMAVPDRAFVTVTAESRSASSRDAQRRNADTMKAVQDRLRTAGIASDAIRTVVVDLHMEYDFTNGKRVPRGYVATNTIEIRVDPLDRLGELLDLVVSSGATAVGDVRFDVKDRAALEREAIKAAVIDARARADAAAAGAGRVVERIVRIDEQGVVAPPIPIRTAAFREAAQAADTPIAAGQMEFRAHVTLTATLK